MGYCTQAIIESRIGISILVELADLDGDGSPDPVIMADAIAAAVALIDSHISRRYSTPLAAPVPRMIQDLSVNLAIYILASSPNRKPTEAMVKSYDESIKLLAAVRDDKQDVPGLSDRTGGADDKTNCGVTDGQERIFGRNNMKDF